MTFNIYLNGWLDRWLNRRKIRNILALLQKNGFAISTVYDIGANKGRWSRDMKRILPGSNFFLFEANESHRKKLSSRGFTFFICVLGSKEETRRFYSIGGTGDSLYLEKTKHYEELNSREVTTQTLKGLVQENKLPIPNFIKLDVQGAELDILTGSDGLLEQCHIIYMECPVLEYNAGAPTFDAYMKFMLERDYVPIQVLEQHLINGALTQFDILFVSKACLKSIYTS